MNASNNVGIWIGASDEDLQLVARTGDAIKGKVLTRLPIFGFASGSQFDMNQNDIMWIGNFGATKAVVLSRVPAFAARIEGRGPCSPFALLMLLQAASATAPQATALVEDARRLTAAATNEARLDALTALLRSRGLAFTVEPFTIAKPVGREPRPEGRNVVLTIGEGPQDLVIGAHYDAVRLPDGSLSRGADDDAASSVMLIGLAETLRAEPLPIRIRVVWFDMEGSASSARRSN